MQQLSMKENVRHVSFVEAAVQRELLEDESFVPDYRRVGETWVVGSL